MTGPEIHALRQTFEQHAREKMYWRDFGRDLSGDYTNRQVAQAWYWLRMGFAAASATAHGVPVAGKTSDGTRNGDTK